MDISQKSFDEMEMQAAPVAEKTTVGATQVRATTTWGGRTGTTGRRKDVPSTAL